MKTKFQTNFNGAAQWFAVEILLALLLLAVPTARALTYTWIGGSGIWEDTNNWSPTTISGPGSSDDVVIGSGTVNVSQGGAAYNLTLAGATLNCNNTGVYVGNNAEVASNAVVVLTGGTGASLFTGGSFNVAGTLTLAGQLNWHDGVLSGNPLLIATSGVLSATSTLNHYFSGSVYNDGQILWSADNLTSGGLRLQNQADGLLNFQTGTLINPWGGASGSTAFINNGSLLVSVGTNAVTFGVGSFTNGASGSITVQSGAMTIYNGNNHDFAGTVTVSNSAALNLVNGTVTLEPGHLFTGPGFYGVPVNGNIILYGDVSDANFQITNGTIYGAITVSGTMNCYDGGFQNTTTVAPGGVVNITGCSSCGSVFYSTSTGGVITNTGTINWLSGDWTCEGDTLVNLTNALFRIECDNILSHYGGLGNWINAGTLRKTASTGTNNWYGANLNNQGLLDLQSGGLQIQNNFTSSGTVNVAAGAGFPIVYGTYYLNPGHQFTGAGYYGIPYGYGGYIYGLISGTNFQMSGYLYGSNTITGFCNDYFGSLQGVTTVASNAVLDVSGNPITGGVLTNAGTIRWLSGNWQCQGDTLVNLPGALFQIQCDNYTSGNGTWLNAGTIRKTAGSGTTTFYNSSLNNTGLFDVQNGSVAMANNSFSSSGTINVAGGAAFPLQSTANYFSPGHNFTGAGFYGIPQNGGSTIYGVINGTNFQMNGSLFGTNTLTGTMNANAGAFVCQMGVASNAVLNLSGGPIFGGYCSLTNAGTINWLSGVFSCAGNTKLINLPGGLVNILCDNALDGYAYAGTGIWLNQGTIRKTAGGGTNQVYIGLDNEGLVDLQSGGLDFYNGFTSGGTFNVAGSASLHMDNGIYYLNPGNHFTGAGYYGVSGAPTVYGSISGTNFQLSGALWGTNTVTGVTTCSGLSFIGSTTVAANGVLNLSGGINYLGGVITNAGTINWLSGEWDCYPLSLLVNQPGALFNILCDASVTGGYSGGSYLGGTWLNAGIIRKSSGTGTNLFNSATLKNTGLLDVQGGALQFFIEPATLGGQLNFGLTGPSQYGRLILGYANPVPLSGTVSVNFLGGYMPNYGDSFDLVSYATVNYPYYSGTFSGFNLPAMPGLRVWETNYNSTAFNLTVIKWKPKLTLAQSGGNFSVSWSSDADPGHSLKYATSLAPPVVWFDVTNSVQVVGDQNVVNLPPPAVGNLFFELQ